MRPESGDGRVLDADSHLMLLPSALLEVLGEEAGRGVARWTASFVGAIEPVRLAALRAGALDDVWRVRGWAAHGADDADQRLAALDRMGIARQLVFPPVTLPILHHSGPVMDAARRRWNDFVLDWASGSAGRLRPVAQLGNRDVAAMVAEAGRVIASGARAVEIPFHRPPGGLSPAHPDLDGLWATLAEARVPVLLHVGGGGLGGVLPADRSFLDPAWGDTDRLRPPVLAKNPPDDFGDFGAMGPFDHATIHLAAEVFLSALVLGGVLERHPGLRVGVIELGAAWVPGWLARLDNAGATARRYGFDPPPRPPSRFVRRQMRFTALYGEPIGTYADGLDDVFVFGTDFPHTEGGRNPVGRFRSALEPLGSDAVERFFVTNGELLLPAA